MKTKSIMEKAMELLETLCQNVPAELRVRREAAANFIMLGELADILVQEFDIKRVFLDAASAQNDGVIFVDTDEVIFEHGCTHQFFQYIRYTDFLNFTETEDGLLRMTFGVKDLIV